MKNRKPMHIGIIPDGNRRWAEQHKLSREAGYAYGLKPGLLLLQQAKRMEFRKSHIMGLPLTIAGVRKNRCRPFSRRVCRRCMILPAEGVDLLVIGNTDSKCFPKEVYKSNCDKRRWYPAEFSCKLWLEIGICPT